MSRQNIYDGERFFGPYQQMRRAQTGLNVSLEQPSMLELLPEVRGAVVLDLGCGEGALSRELATVVASMEHPVKTAAPDPADSDEPAVGDYAEEGPRLTHWFHEGVVKHHRTVATTLNTFIDAGLIIECVLEPAPTLAAIDDHSGLAVHRRRPPLLILRARPLATSEISSRTTRAQWRRP